MGYCCEAKLVFGYMIEDEDYPYPDWDNDESIEKYENWKDGYNDNEYRYLFSYHWDEPNEFFGIILGDCECGEIKTLKDFNAMADNFNLTNWKKCEEEYHRLFPTSTKQPTYYVMSVVW